MSKLFADISMSLDGFVAGPNPSLDDPLGVRGDDLHEWVLATKAWQTQHGGSGGETNASSELVEERVARTGATIMGRRMYSSGEGGWEDDPKARGWWGDDPPFHHPVFVLTHHSREPLPMEGGTTFTFVSDGIEPALELAREAAGGKDVLVAGGAEAIQQYLRAGLLDELQVSVAPVFLGGGARLFDGLGDAEVKLEPQLAVLAPGVSHLRYRVVK